MSADLGIGICSLCREALCTTSYCIALGSTCKMQTSSNNKSIPFLSASVISKRHMESQKNANVFNCHLISNQLLKMHFLIKIILYLQGLLIAMYKIVVSKFQLYHSNHVFNIALAFIMKQYKGRREPPERKSDRCLIKF